MNNSNDTLKVIGAMVIGAITGAALGVLFAPDKGSRTRSKIIGGAKDLAEDLTQKVKDEVAALRNKAIELEEAAEEKMSEIKKGIQQKVEVLKHHN